MHDTLKKVINFEFGRGSEALPPAAATPRPDPEASGTVLLVTTDAASLRWGPRWLGHVGFEVRQAHNADEALREIDAALPALVIVDAAMRDRTGGFLLDAVAARANGSTALVAMCANPREVRQVVDAPQINGVRAEVVRRPYDWEVIASRVVQTVRSRQMEAELAAARKELATARVTAADTARRLSSMRGMDTLTGLPARDKFRTLVRRAVEGGSAEAGAGVLVMKVDRFRQVNEVIGTEAADGLLAQFSERLRVCLRDRALIGGDTATTVTAALGRLSGVRFGLVLSRADVEDIARIRRAVAAELERPFEVEGQSIFLTCTMGAAFFPTDAADADALLHCAERALQEARATRTGFRVFNRQVDAAAERALRMEAMLREALDGEQLRLAYQPIKDSHGRRIVAAEALLRWDHPEEGPISPAEFVPAAEQSGLMLRIGEYVIRESVRQLREWMDAGLAPIRIAVNLSLCQLVDGDLVKFVKETLASYQVPAALVELELSERGVLNQRPEVIEQIHRLRALGVRISIDDFGTGNAAVAYLKDIPADVIKIDRSYVSGAGCGGRDAAIGAGMVAMAKRLNAIVIGEGVETEEQLERVREWGCDEIQGFLFSAAVPPAEVAALLAE